ncbi:MAG: 23S rRNA (pseudouridine(1915)-N(3))-methyltransferase RlmH [Clostridia bacterium]|nr:23S rRNA (pseudouridine(1915)-N(3))-methyltransferase RlmH [Clostridia bacterium]
MYSITVIAVGRLKDKFYDDASAEYLKRLQAYARVTVEEVRAADLRSDDPSDAEITRALEREGEAILQKIPAGAAVAALCIEGKPFSSEDLSDYLVSCGNAGKSQLVFVIGGSCGLSDAVKRRADVRISMSPMTFPHRLARVMLLEQIYRGFKIAKGEKYHK